MINMRSPLITLFLLLSGIVPTLLAQPDPDSVSFFVEALRRAAPDTGRANDGLYSEWQVKPRNIRSWSERCTGVAMSVEEFEADPREARFVLECKLGEVLADQYEVSQNEITAVRRAASWWVSGDPDRYTTSSGVRSFVNRVEKNYQEVATRWNR